MSEARMQETPKYAPGTFCWVELGTTDGEGAKTFYTELLSWDFTDNPMGPGGVYTMLKQDGKDVGGLYQMPPDMIAQGIPTHWLSYVSVASADESADRKLPGRGAGVERPLILGSSRSPARPNEGHGQRPTAVVRDRTRRAPRGRRSAPREIRRFDRPSRSVPPHRR